MAAVTASSGPNPALTCREGEEADAGRFTTAEPMANDIITHRDALRRTAGRVAVAVGLTAVPTWALTLMQFGTDPEATVRASFVTKSGIRCKESGPSMRIAILVDADDILARLKPVRDMRSRAVSG